MSQPILLLMVVYCFDPMTLLASRSGNKSQVCMSKCEQQETKPLYTVVTRHEEIENNKVVPTPFDIKSDLSGDGESEEGVADGNGRKVEEFVQGSWGKDWDGSFGLEQCTSDDIEEKGEEIVQDHCLSTEGGPEHSDGDVCNDIVELGAPDVRDSADVEIVGLVSGKERREEEREDKEEGRKKRTKN